MYQRRICTPLIYLPRYSSTCLKGKVIRVATIRPCKVFWGWLAHHTEVVLTIRKVHEVPYLQVGDPKVSMVNSPQLPISKGRHVRCRIF